MSIEYNEIAHKMDMLNQQIEALKAENERLKANSVSVEEILEIIIEYASTHPQRDWTIGIKPYDNVPMEKRREDNISHWKLLAQDLHDRIYGKDWKEDELFKDPRTRVDKKYADWDFIDFGYRRLRITGLSEKEMRSIIVEKLPEEDSMEVWGLKITKDKPKEYCICKEKEPNSDDICVN